jgi:hypothetical protein
MSTITEQATAILNRLDDQEQNLAVSYLNQLSELHDARRKERNEAYLAKIDAGIRQCTEGRGITRDIIEVEDE